MQRTRVTTPACWTAAMCGNDRVRTCQIHRLKEILNQNPARPTNHDHQSVSWIRRTTRLWDNSWKILAKLGSPMRTLWLSRVPRAPREFVSLLLVQGPVVEVCKENCLVEERIRVVGALPRVLRGRRRGDSQPLGGMELPRSGLLEKQQRQCQIWSLRVPCPPLTYHTRPGRQIRICARPGQRHAASKRRGLARQV